MSSGPELQPQFTPKGDLIPYMGFTPHGDGIPYHGVDAKGDPIPPELMRFTPKGDAIPFMGTTPRGDIIPYPSPPGGNPFSIQEQIAAQQARLRGAAEYYYHAGRSAGAVATLRAAHGGEYPAAPKMPVYTQGALFSREEFSRATDEAVSPVNRPTTRTAERSPASSEPIRTSRRNQLGKWLMSATVVTVALMTAKQTYDEGEFVNPVEAVTTTIDDAAQEIDDYQNERSEVDIRFDYPSARRIETGEDIRSIGYAAEQADPFNIGEGFYEATGYLLESGSSEAFEEFDSPKDTTDSVADQLEWNGITGITRGTYELAPVWQYVSPEGPTPTADGGLNHWIILQSGDLYDQNGARLSVEVQIETHPDGRLRMPLLDIQRIP